MLGKNQSLMLSAAVFAFVAILHLARSLLGLEMKVGNYAVPLYMSYAAALVLGLLAWYLYNVRMK